MIRRSEAAQYISIFGPFRAIKRMLDHRLIRASVLQPPDAPRHVALVVATVPVRDEQIALRVERDVAWAEVRVGAAQQRLLRHNFAALVGNVAKDRAVRAGKAVGAPVAQE